MKKVCYIFYIIIIIGTIRTIFISIYRSKLLVKFLDESGISDEITLPIFQTKPLVIWTSDFHFAPTQDIKHYLQPMGVEVIDKSLDNYGPRCQRRKSCNLWKTLKVINPNNGMHLQYQLIPHFYNAYKNDTEIQSVDAFACFHVSSLCELYEPFNKSLIIIATIRYELGRFAKERWSTWNKNLIKYSSMPWNVVGANNLYDVEYIKYFTGIQPQLLPSWCGYTNQTYNHSRAGFLISITRCPGLLKNFIKNFTDIYKANNSTFKLMPLKEKYRNYNYFDIAAHQGVVHIPYQVSVMSFFEQYRMNIPLFAPSKELILEWEIKYDSMYNKRWNTLSGWKKRRSAIDPHPSQRFIPDPNSPDEKSIRHWINFYDYYQYPYVTYFASIQDLVQILQTITAAELLSISEQMKTFNVQENKRLRSKWKNILLRIANHTNNHPH